MTDSNSIYKDHATDGTEDQYLVYVLYRDEGIPHYVGATKDSRRPYSNRHKARHGYNITSVEIVQEDLSRTDAGNLEDQLINQYGRQVDDGTLVNVKGGGQGLATEETKRKLSLAMKGRTPHNKGKPLSDETKTKISLSNKGRVSPNKGRTLSDEQKAKISLARKGCVLSEETKQKMSLAKTGITLSEETKLKMSLSQKEVWARRKESSLK